MRQEVLCDRKSTPRRNGRCIPVTCLPSFSLQNSGSLTKGLNRVQGWRASRKSGVVFSGSQIYDVDFARMELVLRLVKIPFKWNFRSQNVE
jgi:hypothetical protein